MAFISCAPSSCARVVEFRSCRRSEVLGRNIRQSSQWAPARRRPSPRCSLEPVPVPGTETAAVPPASDNAAPPMSSATGGDAEAVAEPESAPMIAKDDDAKRVPFEVRGFSLANVFLLAGAVVTVVSFSSYFGSNGTASATSLGFVYGVPVLLVGCALKYAELQPIPLETTSDAAALRERKGNATQKKIISDITRHRYGDEAHLSAALSSLGLVAKGMPCPQLVRAAEFETNAGGYCLALDFVSQNVPYSAWEERKERYERFFGPGVIAETEKVDEEKRIVQLRLIAGT